MKIFNQNFVNQLVKEGRKLQEKGLIENYYTIINVKIEFIEVYSLQKTDYLLR